MKKGIIAVMALLIVILSATTYYYFSLYKNQKGLLLEDYYRDLMIVGTERVHESVFKQINDTWWIKADAAIEYIDQDMYYSGSGQRVYLPLENLDLKLENRELTNKAVNGAETINIPVYVSEGVRYLQIDLLESLYPVRHVYYEKTKMHLMVREGLGSEQARLSKSVDLLNEPKKGKLKVGESEKNAFVNVIFKDAESAFVVTDAGEAGYVDLKSLSDITPVSISNSPLREVQERTAEDGRIRLAWQQVSKYSPKEDAFSYDPKNGLDVLSPTWFSLNVDGIVLNIADKAYVEKAHAQDIKVWGLLSNSFDPDWTHEMLSSEILKKRVIAQMITYSALYDLDGVNIDFENVYLKDQELLSDFVADLTEALHQQGMTVSIDVTVPWGSDMWSKVYDRVTLGKIVDYVMLMAYDEHWASSQTPGSVASESWVEKGITETLKLVPKEKLVLGIPFYSRIWSQAGGGKVSSKARGFNGQRKWLKETGAVVSYDARTGQNYAEYEKDGTVQKLWLEDSTSLSMRLELAKKYDLPGIGGWSMLFTTPEVWTQIEEEYPR